MAILSVEPSGGARDTNILTIDFLSEGLIIFRGIRLVQIYGHTKSSLQMSQVGTYMSPAVCCYYILFQ